MSATQITVKHNFETAHRLPFLGGKCENLHGHSWWVTFAIYNTAHDTGVDVDGISAEYGEVKRIVRGWIDKYLDHGTMLGQADPLNVLAATHDFDLREYIGKVFLFGYEHDYAPKPWPTVESVAEMLSFKIQEALDEVFEGLYVDRVELQETHVNGVVYIQGA
jgi:6-pyruvoyltetrahydropterin/6-carboxytetrahydropterin synthase